MQVLQSIWHHLLEPTAEINSGIREENDDASVRYGLESHKQRADSQVNGEGAPPPPQALCLEGREVRTWQTAVGQKPREAQGRYRTA